jgi:tetratricopeptide (TPR) repeat protein
LSLLLVLLLAAYSEGGAEQAGALLRRGLVALQEGHLVEALSALEQASKLDPRNPLPWTSLAEVYFRLKEPKQAAAAAQTAEKLGPENPTVCHALAMYYAEAGDKANAARLEEAYAARPGADAAALSRAASLYLDAGNPQAALGLAERAEEQHPSATGEALLGRALIAAGQPAEGAKQIAAAWEGAPADKEIAFDFTQVLFRTGDFTKAADVLNKALAAHPRDAQLNLALGVARYGQRRFEDAIAAFLNVIRIDPSIPQPYVFIGKMIDQAGAHLDEIVADFQAWAKREPANARAQLLLAEALLARDGKDEKAEPLLRKSIALDAKDWESHYRLGVVLEGRRDYRGAAAELARGIALDTNQPMPHYHLARVYDRLGQPDRAKAEREAHARLTASP